jgi:hypothetical protein
MADTFPSAAQRDALAAFAAALGSASTAFRRDECGDPRINGKRGHIYAAPQGFQLYCCCRSKQAWTWAKKFMSFARPTQDGDEEGILLLDRLPTEAEANVIRDYLGIAKRPDLSEDHVERIRAQGKRIGARSRKNPPSGGAPLHEARISPCQRKRLIMRPDGAQGAHENLFAQLPTVVWREAAE